MNQHKAFELVAASDLQVRARDLAAGYTLDPQDLSAARLALLMTACQLEAREQGITAPLVFSYDGEQE